jgi:hypothetical protein
MFDPNNLIVGLLSNLLTPVGLSMIVVIVTILEVVKIYLPDNIEGKILPAVSIALGLILGLLTVNIWQGIIAGIVATGGYAVIEKQIDKIKDALKEVNLQPAKPK